MSRVNYVCPKCGAPAGATANASWDPEHQKWEVEGVHDEFWCLGHPGTEDGCGWEGSNVKEVELPEVDVHGEDPDYPRADWEHEVGEHDTNLGYWDWVSHRKESDSV